MRLQRPRDAFVVPTPQGVIIPEQPFKHLPSDHFTLFTQGLVEESLRKCIVLCGDAFLEIEPSGLILNVGGDPSQTRLVQLEPGRDLDDRLEVFPIPVDVPVETE